MVDIFSKQKRSEIMALIRSTNTSPEIKLRKMVSSIFYPKGYRYRINYKKIPGKSDIAFVSKKVAIFVDGAFWHGYNFKKDKNRLPKEYWIPKIENNIKRDKEVNLKLKKMGWKVIRIWDHDLQNKQEKITKSILSAIEDS